MPRDPLGKFNSVINLNELDNKEIKRAVLPRHPKKCEQSLDIFDKYLKGHPEACFPPDITTYKGFLIYYAKDTTGCIKAMPTPETIKDFHQDFKTALTRMRDFSVLKSMSTTMKKWIISDIKTKVPLAVDAEMLRDGLSPNNLTILLTQPWCWDFKEYRSK